jgi:putative hydrolase of the HAD superfamily
LKLGIVSNTFVPAAALDRHLGMIGLLPYFPVRIYSGEFGHRKPGRRIFDYALSQIDAKAHETVFVGDRIETDMIGARRAGMITVLKCPGGRYRPHRCVDHVIERISELPNVLAQLRVDSPVDSADLEASELQSA